MADKTLQELASRGVEVKFKSNGSKICVLLCLFLLHDLMAPCRMMKEKMYSKIYGRKSPLTFCNLVRPSL
jgi:hypothetical protein